MSPLPAHNVSLTSASGAHSFKLWWGSCSKAKDVDNSTNFVLLYNLVSVALSEAILHTMWDGIGWVGFAWAIPGRSRLTQKVGTIAVGNNNRRKTRKASSNLKCPRTALSSNTRKEFFFSAAQISGRQIWWGVLFRVRLRVRINR
jgi:hypothetical protein